ncbi:MAG: NAD(P)/FAD-dependent oxidoreductase [Acidocella sp.]|nr:NAD(P)/FAD-dependent oxidoreductase [Acidocella sp.]
MIGAGAAGLFCAATAAARGRRVLLLDHNARAGEKILISGGGRCNFTNLAVGPEHFISNNPHFSKSALAGFTPADFIALVAKAGIRYHEKHRGQLFCDGSAREIVQMLLGMCDEGGVTLRYSCQISEVSRGDRFVVTSSAGVFEAQALVLATGGLSIPKLGATGFAHDIARQFGLEVIPPRPGLVPLVFDGAAWAWMQGLAGVSFEAVCKAGKQWFQEQALFTHRGMSGPAVLQISSYLPPGGSLSLDMLPGQDAFALLVAARKRRAKAELKTILGEMLPARLAHGILQPPLANRVIGDMGNAALAQTAAAINHFSLTPAGDEGFAKAEVTLGGVDTACLSSQTMAARDVPGLYVIGEAVDVTGWLGGYNFQWAWSSGYAAGQAV